MVPSRVAASLARNAASLDETLEGAPVADLDPCVSGLALKLPPTPRPINPRAPAVPVTTGVPLSSIELPLDPLELICVVPPASEPEPGMYSPSFERSDGRRIRDKPRSDCCDIAGERGYCCSARNAPPVPGESDPGVGFRVPG